MNDMGGWDGDNHHAKHKTKYGMANGEPSGAPL
jgi:hypothetical protein